jgi:hypothetical protein
MVHINVIAAGRTSDTSPADQFDYRSVVTAASISITQQE